MPRCLLPAMAVIVPSAPAARTAEPGLAWQRTNASLALASGPTVAWQFAGEQKAR